MGSALQLAQHAQGIGVVHRLLQHGVANHDCGISAKHQLSLHTERLFPGEALHVVNRRLQGAANLGNVGRHYPQMNAKHFEQLSPPG
jgi:ABC-type Fe3+-citrate transport system substrate-binding protein